MYRNGYGWLSPIDQGAQKAGFFINDENIILYWPDKKSQGYEIDEATAVDIFSQSYQHQDQWMLYAFILKTIAIVSLGIEAATSIKTLTYSANVFFIYLSVRMLDWVFVGRKQNSHRHHIILQHFPRLNFKRPKYEFLKPSDQQGRLATFSLIGVSFIISIWLLWCFASDGSFITFVLSLSFGALFWFVGYKEYYGVTTETLKLYKPEETDAFHHMRRESEQVDTQEPFWAIVFPVEAYWTKV